MFGGIKSILLGSDQTMMNKRVRVLEPCPFCGSNDLKLGGSVGEDHRIECHGCDSSGPAKDYPDGPGRQLFVDHPDIVESVISATAIDKWNMRAHKKAVIEIGSD